MGGTVGGKEEAVPISNSMQLRYLVTASAILISPVSGAVSTVLA